MDRATGIYRLLGVTRTRWQDDEGKPRVSVRLHCLESVPADEGFGETVLELKAREHVLDYVRADWAFPVQVQLSLEISQRRVRASGRDGSSYQRDLYDVVVDGIKLAPETRKS